MPDIVRTDNAKKPTPKWYVYNTSERIYMIRVPKMGIHIHLWDIYGCSCPWRYLKCAKFQRFADEALFVNAYNYLCCYGFPKVCCQADALPGSAC